jgi:hypothetical protein
MDNTAYLKDRAEDQINWMEGKAAHNQKKYKQLKVMEIVSAASIPFFAGFSEWKSFSIVTGLLGVVIVILNGVQQLYKYHENWLTYRTTIEQLRREKILFESGSDPYNDADAFQKFVQNFEAILASENKVWKANWMQKAEQK